MRKLQVYVEFCKAVYPSGVRGQHSRPPSTCCRISRNITNKTALKELTVRIMTAPTMVPINAPTMGISAVTPTRVPIIGA